MRDREGWRDVRDKRKEVAVIKGRNWVDGHETATLFGRRKSSLSSETVNTESVISPGSNITN